MSIKMTLMHSNRNGVLASMEVLFSMHPKVDIGIHSRNNLNATPVVYAASKVIEAAAPLLVLPCLKLHPSLPLHPFTHHSFLRSLSLKPGVDICLIWCLKSVGFQGICTCVFEKSHDSTKSS